MSLATIHDTLIRPTCTRDLSTYLDMIWQNFFTDVARVNHVEIAYSAPWKSRLGLIRLSLDGATTFIGINALLQHPLVPEYVPIVTIAHELVHYVHGFGSPLPRRHEHPHAGNVVDQELTRRELGPLLRCCNEWIDSEWLAFYTLQQESGWAELPALRRIPRTRLHNTAGC